MLARQAILKQHSLIKEEDFRAVMPQFSENRASLFAREVEAECPEALEVIRAFADTPPSEWGFRFKAEEVRDTLARTATKFGIVLHGRSIRPNVEADILELWRFLYASNVLNARISDTNASEGYRHLDAGADPMLVTKTRWNEMQAILWEVNPAYRDFLMHRYQEKLQSAGGLPKKKSRPRGRRPTGRRG
jgi:hypothetical protein